MNLLIIHSIRFFAILIIQALILNQIEIGSGIQLMVYPLFIFLLPVELSIIYLLSISFILGLSIDSICNTYGIHTSALLSFAYLRPIIFKLFIPRDGYDPIVETNIFTLGFRWFIKCFGTLLFIHHLWFFLVEIFKINELFFVLQKVFLSIPISFLLCILLQFLFIKKSNEI
ncbi:MAG: hypothetical protein CL844_09100 [Crocinitomicaceae bacterium]|nr:hypothetical protein [Crocinitomicaceae bacterium]|tara:strand:- start:46578 stop:47093 length:516 start_codon:yes stop_codon:yes gene_type:complete